MDRARMEFFFNPFRQRGFITSQAVRFLGPEAQDFIRAWLRKGNLYVERTVANPATPLLLPWIRWLSSSPLPDDLERWAHFVQTRERRPAREIEILRFGRRLLRKVGCPEPDTSKPFQLSHDIQCVEILLAAYAIDPDATKGLIGEDFFATRCKGRLGGWRPDLAVLSPGGKILKVIDYAGASYKAAQLQRMFDACKAERDVIELEVW